MRPLRVVIADGGLTPRSELITLAERAGFDVVGDAVDWPAVVDVCSTRAADLVLVSGSPDFASGVRDLATRASIVISPDPASSKEYVLCGAFAVVTLEIAPEALAASAYSAVARAAELGEARREAADLREALDTRKLVERAKGVLMKRLGIAEDAAYRKMQKASQDENRRMRDIAESILSADRLYGSENAEPL